MTLKQRMPGRRVPALGLALFVALAFSALAASGAEAVTWQSQSGSTVLATGESEGVAGTGSTFVITSTLLGLPVELNCTSPTTSGSITGGGTGSSTVSFKSCTVSKPSKCSLASPLTLKGNMELVQVGGVLFQKFVPGVEGKFAFVEFTGAECPLNEASSVLKGSFAGRELSSALAVNHSLSFTKSEPWPEVALTLGTKAATMTGEVTQHLTRASINWRAIWQGTHGGWEREGTPFSSSQLAFVTGGSAKFNFNIPTGVRLSFSCAAISAKGAELQKAGTETLNGLTFSSCKGEENLANCTVGNSNSLTFANLTGTLTQVGGKTYVKFLPTTPGERITQVYFTGAFCPMAETVGPWNVNGSFAGLGTEFASYKLGQPLEFSDAANEATESALTTNQVGNKFHISGSLTQETWNFIPWGAF